MANYLFLYTGGSYPETEEEGAKVMEAWTTWMGGLGDQLVDGGAPLGDKKTLASNGAITEGGTGVNGYSVVSAGSHDEALTIAKGCPHLDAGGSVEVAVCAQM